MVIRKIFAFIGAALALDGLILIFTTNFNAGPYFTLLIGLVLFCWMHFYEKLRPLRFVLGALYIFYAALIVFLTLYGINDTVTYKEDALIVLGAGIRGESVTDALACRLDSALDYAHKNPDALIVVSGGQGDGEDISEALAMERYLTARGVDVARIIREERSTSTLENFEFSKALLDEKLGRAYQSAFITNNFHIYRANKTARTVFPTVTHLHATNAFYTLAVNYTRECLRCVYMWVFER